MGMKFRWVLALIAGLAIAALSSCINSSTVPANTSLMWVATQGDQMVRAYTINQNNGSISLVGSSGKPVATGVQPTQMVITPDAKSLFIVNSGATASVGTITAYSFNSDGSLVAAGNPVNAGETPVAAAIDPDGKFLFVANQGTSSDVTSGTISVFSISGTSLSAVGTFPTEVAGDVSGTGPSAVVVSPAGSYLYVANQFTNTVEAFSFDASGNLSLVGTYTAGVNPSGLAFSRCAGITSSAPTRNCTASDDNNLFVANSGSNNLSIFTACIQVSATCGLNGTQPTGTLTEISSGSPIGAGVGPSTILVNPTSNFVYVVDRGSSQVSEYSYSPATGVLSSIGTGSGGASVFSGAISANIANNTNTFNWVVVTNNGASSLSIFHVAAAGKLIGLSSGQYSVQGQPSAILLR
jgi:6-phosphogluconolactonase (cycloisomerase 2 family)